MTPFIDISTKSINKYGEELCGDKVEIDKGEDNVIVVLSDGLGSGVKANILATLTSKIACTMLKNGATIEETVDTIVNTLPECQVRQLAYSTFTIIKIHKSGNVYIAEYDNPPIFIYRNGRNFPIKREKKVINDKVIYESQLQLEIGDTISVVSDGAIHAGVGAYLNFGWQWEQVDDYLRDLCQLESTANDITSNFIAVCNNLYDDHPGDDTTIVTVKSRRPEHICILTGPPEENTRDTLVVDKFMQYNGKKIICGGTTANIVSRVLDKPLEVDMDTCTKNIPPIATMDGFDLITEGVLTLKATTDLIKDYHDHIYRQSKFHLDPTENGATMLANILIHHSTRIDILLGQAINPAHQNPDMPYQLNIKKRIVDDLVDLLTKLGKDVSIKYI